MQVVPVQVRKRQFCKLEPPKKLERENSKFSSCKPEHQLQTVYSGVPANSYRICDYFSSSFSYSITENRVLLKHLKTE